MPKLLNGAELAGFIKERQAKQVRMLRQAHQIFPKLVVIKSQHASPVIDSYVRLKQRYAEDILVDMQVISCEQSQMIAEIERCNADDGVHAIVVQLPLDDIAATDDVVNAVAPEKDVDGLGANAQYISATAEAIDWLLSGYGVELAGKNIVIAGQGRLVGKPLYDMWRERGLQVTPVVRHTPEKDELFAKADVIVTATGVPGLLSNDNVVNSTVVVDAGTASEDGKIVGDTASELQQRKNITITPVKGGVGPLTVTLMFDHVIRAAHTKIQR